MFVIDDQKIISFLLMVCMFLTVWHIYEILSNRRTNDEEESHKKDIEEKIV